MASCWERIEYETGEWDGAWPVTRGAYCLLPEDHDGPHDFVKGRDIQVRFTDKRQAKAV